MPVLTVSRDYAYCTYCAFVEYDATKDIVRLSAVLKELYVKVHGKSPFSDCPECWDFVYFMDIGAEIACKRLHTTAMREVVARVFVPPTCGYLP